MSKSRALGRPAGRSEPTPRRRQWEDLQRAVSQSLIEDYRRRMDRITPCPWCGRPLAIHDDAACKAKMEAWQPTGLLALLGSGESLVAQPYIHTVRPMQQWRDCPTCEGAGGHMERDAWVDCGGCGGEEGRFEELAAPSYTIEQGRPTP